VEKKRGGNSCEPVKKERRRSEGDEGETRHIKSYFGFLGAKDARNRSPSTLSGAEKREHPLESREKRVAALLVEASRELAWERDREERKALTSCKAGRGGRDCLRGLELQEKKRQPTRLTIPKLISSYRHPKKKGERRQYRADLMDQKGKKRSTIAITEGQKKRDPWRV